MKFTACSIGDSWIIDLEPRRDERGYFTRAWCEQEFSAHGLVTRVAQLNTAVTPIEGTLRGMHFQDPPHAEVKVVRCTCGAVYDGPAFGILWRRAPALVSDQDRGWPLCATH